MAQESPHYNLITIRRWNYFRSVATNVIRVPKRKASPRCKTTETKCRRYFKLKIPVYCRFNNRHGPSLHTPTPRTCSCKLNETVLNVLQNEDEHSLLDSADTKYDALITHIWALKTTQNHNFAALFTNSGRRALVLMMWCHTQGSKKLTKFRPSSPKCPSTNDDRSLRRPHVLYIFRN